MKFHLKNLLSVQVHTFTIAVLFLPLMSLYATNNMSHKETVSEKQTETNIKERERKIKNRGTHLLHLKAPVSNQDEDVAENASEKMELSFVLSPAQTEGSISTTSTSSPTTMSVPISTDSSAAMSSSCTLVEQWVDVYADYTAGTWGNWSWCSYNASSTTYVHDSQYAMEVNLGAWQAAWFQNEKTWVSFDHFNHLEFWIHGGTSVGHNFDVVVSIDRGVWLKLPLSNYVTTSANNWSQVLIPLADFGVSPGSDITGIGLYNTSSSTVPAFWIDSMRLTSIVPCNDVTISLDTSSTLTVFSPLMFGINTAVWDGVLNDPGTETKLSDAQLSFLRFPGGSTSNQYDWQTSSNKVDGAVYSINSSDFINLSNALGAESLVSVNYGSGSATEAYNWVYDVIVNQSENVLYWGVGNENYGTWETDWHVYKQDAYTYATFTKDFYNSVKALDNTLQVGVHGTWSELDFGQRLSVINPVTGQRNNGWSSVLLSTLSTLNITPDFYEIHFYPQGPNRENDSFLLYVTEDIPVVIDRTKTLVNDYLGVNIPIFITELNSVSKQPGKQTTSFINALFFADVFGKLIQEDVACMWWDVHNAEENGHNTSSTLAGNETYGDYGILANGLGTNSLNTPYPTFHAMKMISLFAAPGDDLVVSSSTDQGLTSYASYSPTDGKTRLLVINKTPHRDINAYLAFSGMTTPNSAIHHIYGETEYNQGVGINTTSLSLNPSSPVNVTFPRYSISVLEF